MANGEAPSPVKSAPGETRATPTGAPVPAGGGGSEARNASTITGAIGPSSTVTVPARPPGGFPPAAGVTSKKPACVGSAWSAAIAAPSSASSPGASSFGIRQSWPFSWITRIA